MHGSDNKESVRASPAYLYPILLLIGTLIGSAVNYDPALGTPTVVAFIVGTLLYAAILRWATLHMRVQTVLGVLVWGAALATLVCFTQYRHLGFEDKFPLSTAIGNLTSAPFPHILRIPFQQNAAATLLEGAIPIAIGLWLANNERTRHLWLLLGIWIGCGVLLTSSRGALVALTVCALIAGVAWLGGKRPRMILLFIMLGALGGIVGWVTALQMDIPALESLQARLLDRLTIYHNVAIVLGDTIYTGVGAGDTFAMIYSRYALLIHVPYITYSHNVILAVWLAQGLLGVLGIIGMTLGITRLAWRAGRISIAPAWMGPALGSLTLLIHGLIDSPQYNTDGWWSMISTWGYIAATVASLRLATAQAPPTPRIRFTPMQRFTVSIATIIIALILVRPALAAATINIGASIEARADLAPNLSDDERTAQHALADTWYQRTLSIDPNHTGAHRRLGIRHLEKMELTEAIVALTHAWTRDPSSHTTRKALGYAYLWNGQPNQAFVLFCHHERMHEIIVEMDAWKNWWIVQQRYQLAVRAQIMARRLANAHE